MTIEQIKNVVIGFLSEEIDLDEVTNVEYQCGGCWIDTKGGKTYSITIMETENDG